MRCSCIDGCYVAVFLAHSLAILGGVSSWRVGFEMSHSLVYLFARPVCIRGIWWFVFIIHCHQMKTVYISFIRSMRGIIILSSQFSSQGRCLRYYV